MLELIQQENWHGLTVYVAVRVAIVLICWVFLAMATFIDMYYGRKAAKAAGEGLRSRKYRRTFNKIGDYIRVMVFALMFDFLAGLFTWYVAPFATVVYTISAVLIEFVSVREKLQKIKVNAAEVPDIIRQIVQAASAKDAEKIDKKLQVHTIMWHTLTLFYRWNFTDKSNYPTSSFCC